VGIDYVLFDRLAEMSTRFKPAGRALMLGRQGFRIQGKYRRHYDQSLKRHGIAATRSDLLQEDGYSETLLRQLGFGEIEAMDFSGYEGAGIIHDLNTRPDPALEEQFDLIFDGGTIEHVFNVPMALEGVYRMLKTGGRFVSANGLNGWMGHGMYQFNPELVWTFWKRACNCDVVDCRAVPIEPDVGFKQVEFRDPAETGHRLRLKNKIGPGRTYLWYEIEKSTRSHLPRHVLQSDYEATWQRHENMGEARMDEVTI